MSSLHQIFRITPYFLVAYAVAITIANVVDLRSSASTAAYLSSMPTEVRIAYITGLVRSFYDLFYLTGLAALVAAANTYLDQGDG